MKSLLMRHLSCLIVFFSICSLSEEASSQTKEENTLIRIKGTVIDQESKSPLAAKVFYEKLPYYDDMGTSSTQQQSGVYELFMLKNTKYTITVKSDNYETISEEIEVLDDGSKLMEKNFEMKLDAAHEIFNLHNLIFARGRAVIDRSSYAELDDFVVWLNERSDINIQLEGHTDFQGNAQANMALSQNRVDAVKEYLTKKGVKKSRIKTKAFGGTQPLTKERTPEAKASNRRVEVRVLK